MAHNEKIKVNARLCTSCRLCEISCSLFHEQVVNMGKARIRVVDDYEQLMSEPRICRQCSSPPCVGACPAEALRQDEQGLIRVDEEACNACENCVGACPYHAIWWQEELGKILVCDFCGGNPTCVQFCSIGALQQAAAD
ncbi:MAG: 4Fe-4S dicluster domain-containing protein [Desulfobacterales bacterium]|nr:4Fe-4S dicluster domain-containing protein [Desulfobacterales bacterium]